MARRNGAQPSRARAKGKRPNPAGGGRPRAKAPEPSMKHYLALAREAEAAGDVVASQNYYQHAEHFFRQLHSPAE